MKWQHPKTGIGKIGTLTRSTIDPACSVIFEAKSEEKKVMSRPT